MSTLSLTIPVIRERLEALAYELLSDKVSKPDAASAIADLVEQLYRRPPVRKAGPKSRHITDEMAKQIMQAVNANPDDTYQDIAVRFGVNAGRVSEIAAGFRGSCLSA